MPGERYESELYIHEANPHYAHISKNILSDKNLSKSSFHNLLTDPRFIAAKAHRFVMGEESESSEGDEDVKAHRLSTEMLLKKEVRKKKKQVVRERRG